MAVNYEMQQWSTDSEWRDVGLFHIHIHIQCAIDNNTTMGSVHGDRTVCTRLGNELTMRPRERGGATIPYS